ncbi:MAG: ParB/RepB/Spo0J family partition protein [Clostridiales bacterium]|jgi:ParB-like protein|nr:ParB/RepB/Spo0J family partition protein [Clostridiales bacterium]PWM23773.1 MAG: chromosome partitioning protein ParB [Clostridiales bacterium]
MAVKKPALGKGLGALIENRIEENQNSVIEVEINQVEPGPGQPRKNFDKEKIDALAESIKEHGIIQPLIVTREENRYYIIAGERRWRAAKAAGFKTIPVIERNATTKEVLELALVENIQREDLNPIEEAEAYAKLLQDYSMTQEQVAAMVGKSRSAIANMLRLLHFSEKVKNLLISGELTTGQARPILALESMQEQDSAAEYILKSGLNARQAEQYVKKLTEKSKQKIQSEEKDISEQIKQQEVRFVQDRLRTSLGTKVILNDHNGRGKITIEYYSKDERERLIEFLTKK